MTEYMLSDLATLGDPGDNSVKLDVVWVVGLDVGGKPVKRALDSLLRRRVHHAGL